MKKEYVCIVCPSSCRLVVEEVDGKVTVTGNTCKRGETHGILEYTNPKRMLTSTVVLNSAVHKRLSVVSTDEIPKGLLQESLNQLYKINVTAPIKRGDVIIENIMGTGVNIVAAHSVQIKE